MAGRVGGNRKPQTFRECARCGATFGPVQRLAQRYCSLACKADAQRVDERHRSVATVEARRAQRRIAYLVSVGRMTKPDRCEECGEAKHVEAAHRDYNEPENVRWLCVSCHRKWDKAMPKGGIVQRWENLTGKKAVLDERSETA